MAQPRNPHRDPHGQGPGRHADAEQDPLPRPHVVEFLEQLGQLAVVNGRVNVPVPPDPLGLDLPARLSWGWKCPRASFAA